MNKMDVCHISRGFSLIEFLLVAAIVSILAAISLPALLSYLDRSAFGACQQELSTFKTQVLATDNLDDALRPFNFGACQVGGDGQPAQAAVADAFRGVFEEGSTALLLDTQRPGVQAQITAEGAIQRVPSP
ncbi:prepilin-type N-terminal cleavage/methylation domain-containing protein [Halomonas sp. M1]|uniref:pilin n=1 Tax=Halomonas sp. M1 TaxID=3035470 RepID=UPI0024864F57|nr:prepilin-type N-terminal cleavage/methylation domain-containing protein [Halomonas sp. M1]WFE71960.1 prepilin-type N-terminal cleavage/methylation domain-containing protein [Halomonas sp. M1]